MTRAKRTVWAAAALVVAGAAVAGTAAARGLVDDDLALVRRAVGETPAATSVPADQPVEPPALRPRARGKDLTWFKVRVVERGAKRSKVTVNLPIAVVRALDDWPVDLHCGHGAKVRVKGREANCSLRLGDLLSGLEAGQDLVTVESDDAFVRVWVE